MTIWPRVECSLAEPPAPSGSARLGRRNKRPVPGRLAADTLAERRHELRAGAAAACASACAPSTGNGVVGVVAECGNWAGARGREFVAHDLKLTANAAPSDAASSARLESCERAPPWPESPLSCAALLLGAVAALVAQLCALPGEHCALRPAVHLFASESCICSPCRATGEPSVGSSWLTRVRRPHSAYCGSARSQPRPTCLLRRSRPEPPLPFRARSATKSGPQPFPLPIGPSILHTDTWARLALELG